MGSGPKVQSEDVTRMTKNADLILGRTDCFFKINWAISGDFTLKIGRSFRSPQIKVTGVMPEALS